MRYENGGWKEKGLACLGILCLHHFATAASSMTDSCIFTLLFKTKWEVGICAENG